jgi:hypothetical protein
VQNKIIKKISAVGDEAVKNSGFSDHQQIFSKHQVRTLLISIVEETNRKKFSSKIYKKCLYLMGKKTYSLIASQLSWLSSAD